MPTKLACPRCRTSFRASRKSSAGKAVACPKCGSALRDVPVAAPFAPPPTGAKSRGLVLACVAVGAVLFLGTGVGLAFLCFAGDRPEPAGPAPEAYSAAQSQAPATPPIKASPAVAEPKPPPPAEQPPAAQPEQPAPQPQAKPQSAPAPEKAPAGAEGPPELVIRAGKDKGGQGWSGSLTAEQQKAVNAAIDRGLAYLRATQLANGSWTDNHFSIGYAALAGLTLLECGVPADDPAVKKAAHHVRFSSGALAHTYQISLAILFLDRLGNSRDRKLIQTLALRLVAGQDSAGGWTYNCPVLSVPEEQYLLAYLRKHQPKHLREAFARAAPRELIEPLADPKAATGKGDLAEGIPEAGPSPPPGEPKLADPLAPGANPKPMPERKKDKAPKTPKLTVPPKVDATRPDFLPPNLRNRPLVVQKGPRGKPRIRMMPARDDNSNTQFAIMALWAARRHYVPMEQTLALVEARFRASQKPGGGWGYQYNGPGQKDAMTCVGLIGLAVGHGSAREAMAPGTAPGNPSAQDEAISRGLRALGGYLDHPGRRRKATMVGTYFLWSVERVGVLYGLKTIGNKDWYRWGVEILLPGQRDDGSWFSNGYPGSAPALDTSMALLFLKRANLTQDLTRTLRLQMAISDPDAAP